MAKKTDNMLEALQLSEAESAEEALSAIEMSESGGNVKVIKGWPVVLVLLLGLLGLMGLSFGLGYRSGARAVRAGESSFSWLVDSPASSSPAEGVKRPSTEASPERGGAAASRPAAASADEPAALSSRNLGTSESSMGSGTTPAVSSEADKAFEATESRFTVLVFTANNSAFGRGVAEQNQRHLEQLGYPAVSARKKGSKVVLYVGAYASRQEAVEAQNRVRQAPGPGGREMPFRDAYIVNIPR